MTLVNYRPRFRQVAAKQWNQHGDAIEVRYLTFWEKITQDRKHHSTADIGMLVVGEKKCVICPGDWIVRDGDILRVVPNSEFLETYCPTHLEPDLQSLVDRMQDSTKSEPNELLDEAISALYEQSEQLSELLAERYGQDTRFIIRRKNHAS